jgi:hypothetical protein
MMNSRMKPKRMPPRVRRTASSRRTAVTAMKAISMLSTGLMNSTWSTRA